MSSYREILQNPKVAFNNSDLQNGKVKTNPLGLPALVSGGFALTACLTEQYTERKWAIRCFHKEVPDLQKRYQDINDFLQNKTENFFVEFEYYQKGIKVHEQWYPIVKMDWIKGDSLNEYVENNLGNQKHLSDLADKIKLISQRLDELEMGHGDLQHGNILVRNHQPILIDYDGMYVPTMLYKNSNEIGHVNFQHPSRNGSFFNKKIDYFASIVLYVSLLSISYSGNKLWNKYHTGENLIFSRKDYQDPDNSALFSYLKTIDKVSTLVKRLQSLCSYDIQDIPSLKNFLNPSISLPNQRISGSNPSQQLKPQSQDLYLKATNLKEIIKQEGNMITLRGKVLESISHTTRYGSMMRYIDFGIFGRDRKTIKGVKYNSFSIVIFSEGIKKIEKIKGSDFFQKISGKEVEITGILEFYRKFYRTIEYVTPQIIWNDPYQLKVISTSESERIKKIPEKIPPLISTPIPTPPTTLPIILPPIPSIKPTPPPPPKKKSESYPPSSASTSTGVSNVPSSTTSNQSQNTQPSKPPLLEQPTKSDEQNDANGGGTKIGMLLGGVLGGVLGGPVGIVVGSAGGALLSKWIKSWRKK